MIKVEVKKTNERIVSISLIGHANSAEYGHDLVCASATAIATGGANALNEKQSFEITINEGKILIRLKDNHQLSNHDEIVLETILVQLQTIEETYGKFIKIKIL